MEGVIAEIKELQRTDATGRAQWEAYTEHHGGSMRDPSKHSIEFLQEFLENYKSGVRLGLGFKNPLIEAVRVGQKKSPAWKRCWEIYCATKGTKNFDPGKHDSDFLLNFIKYLGESGEKRYEAEGKTAPGDKDGDFNKNYPLVKAVKKFQKQSDANKETWRAFCDENLNGTRDPARHEGDILKEFLKANGVPLPRAAPQDAAAPAGEEGAEEGRKKTKRKQAGGQGEKAEVGGAIEKGAAPGGEGAGDEGGIVNEKGGKGKKKRKAATLAGEDEGAEASTIGAEEGMLKKKPEILVEEYGGVEAGASEAGQKKKKRKKGATPA